MSYLISIIIAILSIAIGVVFYVRSRYLMMRMDQKEKENGRKMYELAILKELGDRIGYSLDVHQIIDIITGSLRQFIDYSAVSYMLIQPEKIIFKVQLEKSVNRKFIDDIRNRMLGSLGALLDRELTKSTIDEVLSGAILTDEVDKPVKSFFNIPLVIGEKVVGVLTVSDTMSGLYKEEEMTILYKITQQASNAVTKLEEVVKMEQKKLNSMVESMADGIVMTDNDYRVYVANPAIRTLLGLRDQGELTIFDLIESLSGKFDIRAKLEESVKLGKILETPLVLINDRVLEIMVRPVMSSTTMTSNFILGAVVIFHDITREKELEELRKDFTSMMVHELRSPLDGINKIADLIMRKKSEIAIDKVTNEYVPIIYKSSADMLRLVGNLLDTAKVEAGKYQISKEPTGNIEKIIHDRTEFFEPSARAVGVNLLSVIDQEVPREIDLDPNAITEVFNNYISNSLKFSKPGSTIFIQAFVHDLKRKVTDEAEKCGIKWFVGEGDNESFDNLQKSIIVAVTDTGFGMRSEDLPHLFNKFRQFKSDTLTGDRKGTGLGLVITKGIIEAHGGIVGAASEEGKGSSFYFTLPIK